MPCYSSTYSRTSDSSYEEQRSSTSQSPSLPPNPYSVLGVSENADISEIRKAYLKLILRHHPDKVDDCEKGTSAKEFCKIKDAYDLIIDEARLAEYKEQEMSVGKRILRSGASQPRASTSEAGTRRHVFPYVELNSTTFPLRPFYERCEICLRADCSDLHRWFTRFGYINDLTSQGFSVKGARAAAEEHYGEWKDFDVCEACYKRYCAFSHRKFTREGFVWNELKFHDDLSDDAIAAADIRASLLYQPRVPL